jgi:hypothetical protein
VQPSPFRPRRRGGRQRLGSFSAVSGGMVGWTAIGQLQLFAFKLNHEEKGVYQVTDKKFFQEMHFFDWKQILHFFTEGINLQELDP